MENRKGKEGRKEKNNFSVVNALVLEEFMTLQTFNLAKLIVFMTAILQTV